MFRLFNQYVSTKSLFLMGLESVLIGLAVISSIKLRFYSDLATFELYTELPDLAIQVLVYVFAFEVSFYYNDLYDLTIVRERRDQMIRLVQALGGGCVVLGLAFVFAPALMIGQGVFFISLVVVGVSLICARIVLDRAWRWAAPAHNLLILGTGELAATVRREVARRDDLNLNLIGFIAPAESSIDSTRCGSTLPVIGSTGDILDVVQRHCASRIIVALEDYRGALPIRDLVRLRVQGIQIEDSQSALAALTGRIWISTIRPSWFVFSGGFRRSKLDAILKRFLDLCFSAAGLILSAPLMIAVALVVRLDSKGPALYRQTRVGWQSRPIEILKFRSMRTDAEKDGQAQWAQVSDPRVTRVGKYLRAFRLDELPQFINVLRGDMSFVGPRPERPDFVDKLREIIPFYDERHSVRPGLTGWAQVQFPYGATVEDAERKLEYDLFYLKHMSVLFDCAIVFQTVRTVLFGQGGR